MGLFDAIRKQLLKVIEWKDDTENTIVYRYPIQESRDEIMNGCQLVKPSTRLSISTFGTWFVKKLRMASNKLAQRADRLRLLEVRPLALLAVRC